MNWCSSSEKKDFKERLPISVKFRQRNVQNTDFSISVVVLDSASEVNLICVVICVAIAIEPGLGQSEFNFH